MSLSVIVRKFFNRVVNRKYDRWARDGSITFTSYGPNILLVLMVMLYLIPAYGGPHQDNYFLRKKSNFSLVIGCDLNAALIVTNVILLCNIILFVGPELSA